MMQNDQDKTGTEQPFRINHGRKSSESRSPHSIRFSDSEWNPIEKRPKRAE